MSTLKNQAVRLCASLMNNCLKCIAINHLYFIVESKWAIAASSHKFRTSVWKSMACTQMVQCGCKVSSLIKWNGWTSVWSLIFVKWVLFRRFFYLYFRFIKPLLTHARPPLTETLPQCCLPLAKLLTTDEQLQQVRMARKTTLFLTVNSLIAW